ncbi:unnamed protein product [Gadus morhua 'NCC']
MQPLLERCPGPPPAPPPAPPVLLTWSGRGGGQEAGTAEVSNWPRYTQSCLPRSRRPCAELCAASRINLM